MCHKNINNKCTCVQDVNNNNKYPSTVSDGLAKPEPDICSTFCWTNITSMLYSKMHSLDKCWFLVWFTFLLFTFIIYITLVLVYIYHLFVIIHLVYLQINSVFNTFNLNHNIIYLKRFDNHSNFINDFSITIVLILIAVC